MRASNLVDFHNGSAVLIWCLMDHGRWLFESKVATTTQTFDLGRIEDPIVEA